MKEGDLQQYEPPLEVYKEPANLFVADFVGNPSMNFVQCDAKQLDSRQIELNFHGVKAVFSSEKDLTLPDAKRTEKNPLPSVNEQPKETEKAKSGHFGLKKADAKAIVRSKGNGILDNIHKPFVLGIRPEFVKLVEKGGLPVRVYSSLPSGMETTVKFVLGDAVLTSVVFGIIDYPVDSPINVDFQGDGVLLYDGQTSAKLGNGTLKIVSIEKDQ